MRNKSTIIFSVIVLLLLGAIGGGIWVTLNNRQAQPLPDNQTSDQAKAYTLSEVAQHASKDDCWAIISGDVYDLTEFINRHPGGDEILRACGTDATTLFNSRQTQDGQWVGSGTPHSQAAMEQLAKLKIGTVNKR
jgi:cytochrome b involved in lipid metabolism